MAARVRSTEIDPVQEPIVPNERVIEVTEAEIRDVLKRHARVVIDNATLITLWPLCDDMADLLAKIIGEKIEPWDSDY